MGKLWDKLLGRNSTLVNPEQWFIDALLGSAQNVAGVTVNPLTALGVSTVFACVNRIAGTVSSIPLVMYRRTQRGKERAVNHPLYYLLHDAPNPEMTSVDFRRTMQGHLSLRNNADALIVRDGLGSVAELWPLDPSDVMKKRSGNGPLEIYVKGELVAPNRVVSLRGLSANGIVGMDTVSTAREVIALAIALQDNAARFFGNNSRPGAILEHPGVLKADTAKRIRESFEAFWKGKNNAYRVAVLEEGMKYIAQRSENKDSQFLESRNKQDIAICQVFGVPPHKVALLDKATFSNIEQQNIEYVVDTVLPQLRVWEQTLNHKLLSAEERRLYFFEFQIDGLLRGDIKSRFDAYAVAVQNGWMSRNEVREKETMNSVPGLDAFMHPANMVIEGQEPAEKPEPAVE